MMENEGGRGAIPGELVSALALFGSRELDIFPGMTPCITNNQRLFFGLPGQKLIGIDISYEAPHTMKSIRQREPASAAAIKQTRD